jgi:hypothetical protein
VHPVVGVRVSPNKIINKGDTNLVDIRN